MRTLIVWRIPQLKVETNPPQKDTGKHSEVPDALQQHNLCSCPERTLSDK